MADQETPPSAPGGKRKRKPAKRNTPKSNAVSMREGKLVAEIVAGAQSDYEAAIKAGYSVAVAKHIYRVLNRPHVQEAIRAARRKLEINTDITAARTLTELGRLAFSSMKNYLGVTDGGDAYVDFTKLDDDQWAAVQEIVVDEYMDGRGEDARAVKRTRFKLASKMDALKTIAQHLGMLSDRVEVTHRYENMDRRELTERRMSIAKQRAEVLQKLKEKGIEIQAPPTVAQGTRTVQ